MYERETDRQHTYLVEKLHGFCQVSISEERPQELEEIHQQLGIEAPALNQDITVKIFISYMVFYFLAPLNFYQMPKS